jgi:hypothetical protein
MIFSGIKNFTTWKTTLPSVVLAEATVDKSNSH